MNLKDIIKEQKRTLKIFKFTYISSHKDLLVKKLEALYQLEEIEKELIK